MMTQERAKYILANTLFGGAFKHAFRPKSAMITATVYPDGITIEEDQYIRLLWDKMPGNTCYYDAVVRIAKGELDLLCT